MARTVKQIPEVKRKRDRYPWARWSNGKTWRVTPQKEYGVESQAFRRYVVIYANRKSLSVSTRVSGDVVFFQFRKKEG